jgi:REP element-mobilizing transposase RayT
MPKYRKRVLTGQVAERTRDVLRQICMEHEIHIVSGKVAADHVHMFVSYRPQMAVTKMVQYLKGKLAHSASGLRAVAQTVLGPALMGAWLHGNQLGKHNRRNDTKVH